MQKHRAIAFISESYYQLCPNDIIDIINIIAEKNKARRKACKNMVQRSKVTRRKSP